jgi:hypothetical protein
VIPRDEVLAVRRHEPGERRHHRPATTRMPVIIPRRRLTVGLFVSVSMTVVTPIGLERLPPGAQ